MLFLYFVIRKRSLFWTENTKKGEKRVFVLYLQTFGWDFIAFIVWLSFFASPPKEQTSCLPINSTIFGQPVELRPD